MKKQKIREIRGDKNRKPSLVTKVFALFFATVFLISFTNLLVFSNLLNTLEAEANALNNEQVNSASLKLDAVMAEIQNRYISLLQVDEYQSYAGIEPSAYTQHQMYVEASVHFNSCTYIHSWAVLLRDTETLVNCNGVSTREHFFNQICTSEAYSPDFWQKQIDVRFSREFYPSAEFLVVARTSPGISENVQLMPVALKSYWKNNIMVLLFLDMDAVCAEVGPYMQESSYIFSEDGTLLYSSDSVAKIRSVPETDKLTGESGVVSVFKTVSTKSGLQYIKLIPESQAMGMVRSSQNLYLLATVLSLAVATVLIILSVRRTLHPVNGMLNLLQEHSGLQSMGDIREAHSILEQVLRQREEQAQALAQRDAVLSEYFLRSQLKSVYVDLKQHVEADEGAAYILYIQVQYRENVPQYITMPRAELESFLQEMLSGELNKHFETTLIFQIEPGCFAAKVTLLKEDMQISSHMERFMARLEQEREFAYFTVVQSHSLVPEDDLAEVYAAVLQAARQASVCEDSQLIRLESCPKENDFLFSKQDEQRLAACVHARQIESAAELAAEILESNLQRGITHAQMEVLCVAVVNTVAYAMSELLPGVEKLAAISGVYNALTAKCHTAKDYHDAVLDFIRSCGSNDAETGERDVLLKKVQQYLKENYRREFSGEEMAEELKVSRSYLSSYYKTKTGMNLSDSIQYYRIQKAMELMKDPDIKISEVGAMVGISSGNTFLRQFKKYTGMSPKEYRTKRQE